MSFGYRQNQPHTLINYYYVQQHKTRRLSVCLLGRIWTILRRRIYDCDTWSASPPEQGTISRPLGRSKIVKQLIAAE